MSNQRPFLPIVLWGLHPLYWVDARLFAVHVETLRTAPSARDSHFLGEHPISKAEVAGTVVATRLTKNRQILLLDDGTGSVQVSLYSTLQDGTPTNHYDPRIGDIIEVAGKIINAWKSGTVEEKCREIRVRTIRRLESTDALCLHWLETARLHATQYSKPLSYWLQPTAAVRSFLNWNAGSTASTSALGSAPAAAACATDSNNATAVDGSAASASLDGDDDELSAVRGYVYECITTHHPWYRLIRATTQPRVAGSAAAGATSADEYSGDAAMMLYPAQLIAPPPAFTTESMSDSEGAGTGRTSPEPSGLDDTFTSVDVTRLLRARHPLLFVPREEPAAAAACSAQITNEMGALNRCDPTSFELIASRVLVALEALVEAGRLFPVTSPSSAPAASSASSVSPFLASAPFSSNAFSAFTVGGPSATPLLHRSSASSAAAATPSAASSPFGLVLQAAVPALLALMENDPATLMPSKRRRRSSTGSRTIAAAAAASADTNGGSGGGDGFVWTRRQLFECLRRTCPACAHIESVVLKEAVEHCVEVIGSVELVGPEQYVLTDRRGK